ncbi:hypothetical protein MCUN1_003871 [Malassezia cuniculi]|uniref:Uncharacterized protein n=1 Tax=Malassezia cuniculi TaxID=948313 RepID=A0AAF0EYV9_9BASI|nr:hypothetical protein MCUN1_003871 [Malassezia cuniculi]
MLPFVPRSVAGIKRQHPLGGEKVPPRTASTDLEHAKASSPQVVGRIADALLAIVPELAREFAQDTHVMRMLDHDAVRRVCAVSAHLLDAFRLLAQLGCVEVSGYHVSFSGSDTHTLFVEGIPGHRRPLEAAQFIHALAGGVLYGIYAPSADGVRVQSADELRSAFVVVDAAASAALLERWGWNSDWMTHDKALTGQPSHVVDAALANFRCMPRDTWLERRDEYLAWRHELIAQNTATAKKRADERREHEKKTRTHTASACVQVPHVFFSAPITRAASQAAYKSYFAQFVQNAVDYIDVRADEGVIYQR